MRHPRTIMAGIGLAVAAGFSDNNTTGRSFIALARYNP